ncbi:hypothetical protein V9T40_011758 [Parthenolecanium corni]|uniref:Uncharacterized protein n=1 Tax=Parthenolecanium corni TaxID=536013 RepID=A0AAN9TJA1_9HEMI
MRETASTATATVTSCLLAHRNQPSAAAAHATETFFTSHNRISASEDCVHMAPWHRAGNFHSALQLKRGASNGALPSYAQNTRFLPASNIKQKFDDS